MHLTACIAASDWTRVSRGVMRCALLLCWLSTTGCSLFVDTAHVLFLAKRTTKLEPKNFPYIKNEKLSQIRDVRLAKTVWAEVAGTSDVDSFSKDYRRGFLTGFADYMYRGGAGEAPLIPPRDYWRLGYQSAKGKQATQAWYDGFRHGVDECQARGYRDMVVVRSSLLGSQVTLANDTQLPIESRFFEPTPAEDLPPPVPDSVGMPPEESRVESRESRAEGLRWSPLRSDNTDGEENIEAQIPRRRPSAVGARLRRN